MEKVGNGYGNAWSRRKARPIATSSDNCVQWIHQQAKEEESGQYELCDIESEGGQLAGKLRAN